MNVESFKGSSKILIRSENNIYEYIFPEVIVSSIQLENKLIVLIDTMGKSKTDYKNRNIYCLNNKAQIVWQIQDRDTYQPGLPKSDSPFTGMKMLENGKLRVYNWDSYKYEVDLETGKLLNPEQTK